MGSEQPPWVFTPKMIGLLVTAAVLIIFSMIFSAGESAFLSINKLRLKFLRNKGDKKAVRAARLLDKKEKLLNTILVGNNLVNISLSAIITFVCIELFGITGLGLATLAVTVILLIFGEILPKSIAIHYPEKIAFTLAPFIEFVGIFVTPFVFILTKTVRFIAKIFHINIEAKKVSFTEEDIKQYIKVGEEEGILENGEKIMMNRVFKFRDLSAHDIMTPRTKIKAIPIDISYRNLIEFYEKTNISRFPVYKANLDDIKGILYMKDVLFSKTDGRTFKAKDIMRPPLFILENKKMSSVQEMMDKNSESIAVVIDEYSGTAGVLTKKDIAKEIFGYIYDEFDTVKPPQIKKISDNQIIADGSVRLVEINEIFSTSLKSKNYETLNGFLTEIFDGFPEVENVIKIDPIEFKILDVGERKINKILITKESK
ncbi:MAG: hemolysin family protein [Treponemataceae bacterium]